MNPNFMNLIPALEGEELIFLQSITRELNQDKLQSFVAIYNGKRRKTDQVLLGCILGFFGIAGIQRFMVGQNGMGILYLFTAGFCCIGTIIDIINHKQLTFDYNQQMARETMAMVYSFN
ncbi:MAG: TM2 domain-containing protein [Bacteroidota bacterium]